MSIFKSRKFWIMVADVVISTVTFFVVKYAAPDMVDNIKFLIVAWQPVIISVIAGIAVEDASLNLMPPK